MYAAGYPCHGSMRNFSQAVEGHLEYPASNSISCGVMHLVANWTQHGLGLYDTKSWSQPLVHDSASPENMAGESAVSIPLPYFMYLGVHHIGIDICASSCAHRMTWIAHTAMR